MDVRSSFNARGRGDRRFCNHVHVRRDHREAKVWMAPAALARSRGFSSRELNDIRRIIIENESLIIEAWHEHCGTHGI